MIADVLPSSVAWFEVVGALPEAELLPAEEPLVAHASPKRRREFTYGRHCARQALARLGVEPAPVLAGPRGEPRWPSGVVGSITHCAGYTAAAVAWAQDVPTIGIDAEPNEPLPAGVLDAIALSVELTRLPDDPGPCWDRLLFAAKEAVYKAWYPLTERILRFEDVAVVFRSGNGFQTNLDDFGGRWTATDEFVVTAAAMEPPPPPSPPAP